MRSSIPHFSWHSGFTLIELMIVMAIIIILFSITLFPYDFYMERARVEKESDMISQEWILQHNAVRNGLLYSVDSHAHIFLHFATWSSTIEVYESTGMTSPQRLSKSIMLDKNILIQSFTGIEMWSSHDLWYHIVPPYGKGYFSTGSSIPESIFTGVIMTFGYPDASLESGRSRKILLRPYY